MACKQSVGLLLTRNRFTIPRRALSEQFPKADFYRSALPFSNLLLTTSGAGLEKNPATIGLPWSEQVS